MTRACDIESALGREVTCPERACPLYENGACVVVGLRADLGGSPELARLLLTVRDALGPRPAAFAGLPAPGLHD